MQWAGEDVMRVQPTLKLWNAVAARGMLFTPKRPLSVNSMA